MQKAKYSTWIRKKKIILFSLIFLCLITIAILRINLIISIVAALLAIPFVYIAFLISYTYYEFSSYGGNYQSKIHDLIVSTITTTNGKLLDIGTGSASLIIKASKSFPELSLTGIDHWGDEWEYSKKRCEWNARIEGVEDKISFQKCSASELPFKDKEFDIVISCLTFHEVKDEKDKIKVLIEALRVLREKGEFIFLDLFLDKGTFGEYEKFENDIRNLGLTEVEFIKLNQKIKLPKLLWHKKILGNGIIIKGKK